MSCCGNGGWGLGLGQTDPVTIGAIGSAITHARDLWNDIKAIFGIGAGAREADVISPLQNQITNTVLVHAAEMTTNPEGYTCTQFQQQLGAINSAYTQYKTYLTTTDWQDGRAAQQALWWLTGIEGTPGQEPWFKIITDDFREAMAAKCSVGGIPGGPILGPGGIFFDTEGNVNWPVIALAGGAIYMLSRKKGG